MNDPFECFSNALAKKSWLYSTVYVSCPRIHTIQPPLPLIARLAGDHNVASDHLSRQSCNELYGFPARWAPTSFKWSYNPYKWPYKWVTGVITLLIGVITPLITGRGPPCVSSEFFWALEGSYSAHVFADVHGRKTTSQCGNYKSWEEQWKATAWSCCNSWL